MTEPENPAVRAGLDATMRVILTRLLMVSHGTTSSLSPTAGSHNATIRPGQGHPEGRPAGCNGAEHLYWRDRYQQQTTNYGRRQIITDAENELRVLTGRTNHNRPPGETPDQTIARMLHETAGWTPDEVQQSSWRMSSHLVRKHRIADSRHPQTGHPVTLRAPEDAALEHKAREMRAKGMTLRQIGLALSKDQKQIQRYLKRAA